MQGPTPRLEPVTRILPTLDPPIEAGVVPGGLRGIIPITGGTAEGPGITGEILPVGADWNQRNATSVSVSAKYLVRTHDGVVLTIFNEGSTDISGGGFPIGITSPVIEAPEGSAYAWLNTAVLVGTLSPLLENGVPRGVAIEFFRVVVD